MGAIQSESGTCHRDELGLLRGQLTNLRALLVLSILMTESSDDEQILRLATSAAASLGSWQIAGFVIAGQWWADGRRRAALEPGLAGQFRALPKTGGPVTLDAAWAWAYPLRSIAGRMGYLVVHADHEPAVEEQFLAQVLAQQTGVAVSNAQLHGRERDTAAQLAAANDTIAGLRDQLARDQAALDRERAEQHRLTALLHDILTSRPETAVGNGGQRPEAAGRAPR